MTHRNEKGIALAISLLVVLVILILGSVFVVRSTSEKKMSDRERMSVQAFYIGDGGSHAGLSQINTLINTNMLATINATNPQTVGNDAQQYVNNNDSIGFLIKYVKVGSTAQFVLSGTQAKYAGTTTNLGNGTYRFDIFVTKKGNPVTVQTDVWDFPFYYRIESTGTSTAIRKVALSGDFTVRVQRDNFAKYALFTDHHTMPSGTPVWFTSKTNFAGPIHTNDQLNFAHNPSGTFNGAVTQQNTKGKFYNSGNPVQINADNNSPYDVPIFNSTYTRGVAEIVLSSSVQQQDLIDQARGTDNTPGNGIFVANNGSSLNGGIYVSGDATVSLGVDGSNNALYTITQGSTTKNITVNILSNQTTVQTVGGGSPQTYNGLPNGVDGNGAIIYVNGAITGLSGTVQKDTEVTVSSQNDIVITNNIKYQDYTSGVGTPGTAGYIPPNADGKKNLLGVVCWGGNVRIGASAPNDVEIHGPVMARNGIFTVDNYNGGSPRGTVTFLGGAITQFYGAFGTFNGSTGQLLTGYGRNFNYDGRMSEGKSPPYFPSMKTFIAFTNDITDKITWQEGGF